MERINSIVEQLEKEITNVKDLEGIKQIRSQYLSKSDLLAELKASLPTAEDKAAVGALINEYTGRISQIIESKKEELENTFDIEERVNPILTQEAVALNKEKGESHPLTKIAKIVSEFFDELNYEYAHGIEVETEAFNFDALNIPANHPARTMQDTFYLEGGKLLRTHCTNITARHLAETTEEEFKSYSIGTVFRNDDNDATHSFQFNQIDIFQIGKDVSIANLKWTLDTLLERIFEEKLEVRYRPSYFPFTEPSFEVDIKRTGDDSWIEILGCGMIHPEVIRKAGKDPEKLQGFAAGIGVERLAMLKYGIKDIRDFTTNDIDFLKGVK